MQEVHSTKDTEVFWLAEWGYKGIFSSQSSLRAGVCILFNNNFVCGIKKILLWPLISTKAYYISTPLLAQGPQNTGP